MSRTVRTQPPTVPVTFERPVRSTYAGVASIFASALAAGRAPQVFEDGGQLRDFVHVRDVARANVLALTAAEPVPGAYNVSSGRPRSVGDMARALWAADRGDAPGPQVTGAFRLGDVRHVFASPERAATRLGFRAHEAFEDGMAELSRGLPRAGTQARPERGIFSRPRPAAGR